MLVGDAPNACVVALCFCVQTTLMHLGDARGFYGSTCDLLKRALGLCAFVSYHVRW